MSTSSIVRITSTHGETQSYNATSSPFGSEMDLGGKVYEENKLLFWVVAVIFLFIGLIAVVGNGIVLHVSHYSKNTGPLENLDIVIKSLAIADALYGLVGIPCRMFASMNEGMYFNDFIKVNFNGYYR